MYKRPHNNRGEKETTSPITIMRPKGPPSSVTGNKGLKPTWRDREQHWILLLFWKLEYFGGKILVQEFAQTFYSCNWRPSQFIAKMLLFCPRTWIDNRGWATQMHSRHRPGQGQIWHNLLPKGIGQRMEEFLERRSYSLWPIDNNDDQGNWTRPFSRALLLIKCPGSRGGGGGGGQGTVLRFANCIKLFRGRPKEMVSHKNDTKIQHFRSVS